ncbi:MAG TPA: VLRF1 family aeRF1-type release factor [Bacteroidales bacterium]|jgi:hypothetical protein|nr:VLRF1 family aeRF1-type release factor [Bacteroidales bacterium]HOB76887.1 VLRF1 family aeRF1-type release factor [Bacteroidales bacterium]HPZ60686.1 VLRF1 family aeRF1-type release factor [Bacteroidales bacterium]HQD58480.1 VLRF1 family aeRF1-type release factor [Bacteroidales bacterium]
MINLENIKAFKERIESVGVPILSVYCDTDPSKDENKGMAWMIRIKNALKEYKELEKKLKNRRSFLDEFMLSLQKVHPQTRTLVIFAWVNEKNVMQSETFELQIDLPAIDLTLGRIDVHYGKPYLLPIYYAFDEYERIGVLHIYGTKWRFYEVFLNEVEEITDTFATITTDEWKEIQEHLNAIDQTLYGERNVQARIKFKDKFKSKYENWSHKLYNKLAKMIEKSIQTLDINRLILMGTEWQLNFFENYLSHNIKNIIIGHLPNPTNAENPSKKEILERVSTVIEKTEYEEEKMLLDLVYQGNGISGLSEVLKALQIGRVQVLLLPWDFNAIAYMCSNGLILATKEEADQYCGDANEIYLRDYIEDLTNEYSTRIEFVKGEIKDKLYTDLGGIAGVTRW